MPAQDQVVDHIGRLGKARLDKVEGYGPEPCRDRTIYAGPKGIDRR